MKNAATTHRRPLAGLRSIVLRSVVLRSAALLACLAGTVPAFAQDDGQLDGQDFATFGDWSAGCGGDACFAETQSGGASFSLGRNSYHDGWSVNFGGVPAGEATLLLNGEFLGSGQDLLWSDGDETMLGDELLRANLIERIRNGDVLTLEASGRRHDFSLRGFTAAVLRVEEGWGAVGEPRVAGFPYAYERRGAPVIRSVPRPPAVETARRRLGCTSEATELAETWTQNGTAHWLVPCNLYAYQADSILLREEGGGGGEGESSLVPVPVTLASREGGALVLSSSLAVLGASFDPNTLRLTGEQRYRGLGGCGASHVWSVASGAALLVEARERTCTDDVLDGGAYPIIYSLGRAER